MHHLLAAGTVGPHRFFATKAGGYVAAAFALAVILSVFAASRHRRPVAIVLAMFMSTVVAIVGFSPAFRMLNLRGRELAIVLLWLPLGLIAVTSAIRAHSKPKRSWY